MDLNERIARQRIRTEARLAILNILRHQLQRTEWETVLVEVLAEVGAASTPSAPRPVREASDTYSNHLLSLLRESPGLPVGELALALYKDANATAKVRSLLSMLKKRQLVQNETAGRWEVVAPIRKGL